MNMLRRSARWRGQCKMKESLWSRKAGNTSRVCRRWGGRGVNAAEYTRNNTWIHMELSVVKIFVTELCEEDMRPNVIVCKSDVMFVMFKVKLFICVSNNASSDVQYMIYRLESITCDCAAIMMGDGVNSCKYSHLRCMRVS